MAQVLVRDLDDDIVTTLKRRAKARGTSLQEIAREALTVAARPSREEALSEIDRIRSSVRSDVAFDSLAELRRLREGEDDARLL